MDLLALRGRWPSAQSRCRAGLAATLGLAALGLACGKGSTRGTQAQGPPGIPVKVETAKLISVNDTTEYVSTLKSRATAVMTTCLSPIRRVASATRSGSSGSNGKGFAVVTAQNPQARVQRSPAIMKVAVPLLQHSQ